MIPDTVSTIYVLITLGVLSAILSTVAFLPYITDTLSRRTQPQRASWLIWSVLGSIAFFSQSHEGATVSLLFAGVQVSFSIMIFCLSIWVGKGSFLQRTDYAILATAALGLVTWYFTNSAAYALAITISISLLGGVATISKAYRDPDSETIITWVLSLLASVCAILSVGKLDPVILAYPVYLFVLYLAFVTAILLGRAKRRRRNMGIGNLNHAPTHQPTNKRAVSLIQEYLPLRPANAVQGSSTLNNQSASFTGLARLARRAQ